MIAFPDIPALGHGGQQLSCPFDHALLIDGLETCEPLGALPDGLLGMLESLKTDVKKQRNRRNRHEGGRSQDLQAEGGMPDRKRGHQGRPERRGLSIATA